MHLQTKTSKHLCKSLCIRSSAKCNKCKCTARDFILHIFFNPYVKIHAWNIYINRNGGLDVFLNHKSCTSVHFLTRVTDMEMENTSQESTGKEEGTIKQCATEWLDTRENENLFTEQTPEKRIFELAELLGPYHSSLGVSYFHSWKGDPKTPKCSTFMNDKWLIGLVKIAGTIPCQTGTKVSQVCLSDYYICRKNLFNSWW